MAKKFLIIFMCALIIACSDSKQILNGHWVAPSGNKAVAEVTDDKITVTLLNDNNNRYVASYTKTGDSTFDLKGFGLKDASKLLVDWKNKSFSISAENETLSFVQAPNVSLSDIEGTWYSHEKDGNYEFSTIVTQKGSSYDYDSLELNHLAKTYTKQIDRDIKFDFSNGFKFREVDEEAGHNYTYYLIAYETDTITFIDSGGVQWTEHRKPNATHIPIPKGYTETD